MDELELSPARPSSLQLTSAKRKRNHESTPEPSTTEGTQILDSIPRKRKHLRVNIPAPSDLSTLGDAPLLTYKDIDNSPISGLSEPDSLFDEEVTTDYLRSLTSSSTSPQRTPALLVAPPIQGLFFTPALSLPEDVADTVKRYCLEKYFEVEGVNQVMLFGRFLPQPDTPPQNTYKPTSSTGLPPILIRLLSTLDTMLLPLLPPDTHALLFPRVPTRARQAILNLYQPGEGISPHVDLLKRFGDGIIGVSLGSGCVMQFARAEAHEQLLGDGPKTKDSWDVYLPERSILVLSEDARYGWTHGIDKHKEDYVAVGGADSTGRWIERSVRLSITFRWLLPGADVVGDGALNSP